MKTLNRICIEDFEVTDGKEVGKVERGKEYLTTEEKDGEVTVFTNVWFSAPSRIFAGEKVFTNASKGL